MGSGPLRGRDPPRVLIAGRGETAAGQAMKAAGIVSSGIDAKMLIQDGQVTVNGEVETRRGKKLYDGDVFEFEGEEFKVVK